MGPLLLDRLAGRPHGPAPFGETVRVDALKASVRAELSRLLNTRRPTAGPAPEGGLSVLDYGVSDFTGSGTESRTNRILLARRIEEAILAFEPRLADPLVQVTPDAARAWLLRVAVEGSLRSEQGLQPAAFLLVIDTQAGAVVE